MEPKDKARMTRATNELKKCNKSYMSVSSPYVIDKYRKALIKYREMVTELKAKYRGMQLDFEL